MEIGAKKLQNCIKSKRAKIGVIGLGYVGLPLAIEFAKKGFCVYGIELDNDRLASLKKGASYISDVKTVELKKVIHSKKFYSFGSLSYLKEVDVILICVPTPLKRKYSPDISFIKNAVYGIEKNIKKGTLVILESTTYPGTTEEVILPILEKNGLKHGDDFFLCFSPERIDPGNEKFPLRKIPKVIGGISQDATNLGARVYEHIIDKVVPVSSARVAESVKLLENTYRLINIGLIDEMAMMAHKMNIDIWEIIDAAKTKPFGFMPFYPGPGVGGHCIPKDPLYLYWKAKHHGFSSKFIKLASGVISSMPAYIIHRVEQSLTKLDKKLENSKILVVGVTYKKDIKDLRKSPALDMIACLKKRNIAVSYFDPLIPYLKIDGINLESIEFNSKKIKEFDCLIIATDHSNIDYRYLLNAANLIFDTRNVYKNIKSEKVARL